MFHLDPLSTYMHGDASGDAPYHFMQWNPNITSITSSELDLASSSAVFLDYHVNLLGGKRMRCPNNEKHPQIKTHKLAC